MGNHSAERIEALVKSHKTLLANASHELRSPLARLRLGLESIQEAASDGVRQELARNIAELDQLIEEILLASRLGADSIAQEPFDDVDLTGLVAEECARMEVKFDGEMATLQGNPKLLRRMVRNLLDNARRHGTGSAIEASLHKTEKHVLELRVCDRGPGIPNAAREKIFEPFYRLPGEGKRRWHGAGPRPRQANRHTPPWHREMRAAYWRRLVLHRGDSYLAARNQIGRCRRVLFSTGRT